MLLTTHCAYTNCYILQLATFPDEDEEALHFPESPAGDAASAGSDNEEWVFKDGNDYVNVNKEDMMNIDRTVMEDEPQPRRLKVSISAQTTV